MSLPAPNAGVQPRVAAAWWAWLKPNRWLKISAVSVNLHPFMSAQPANTMAMNFQLLRLQSHAFKVDPLQDTIAHILHMSTCKHTMHLSLPFFSHNRLQRPDCMCTGRFHIWTHISVYRVSVRFG